jgi:hypothetical protein
VITPEKLTIKKLMPKQHGFGLLHSPCRVLLGGTPTTAKSGLPTPAWICTVLFPVRINYTLAQYVRLNFAKRHFDRRCHAKPNFCQRYAHPILIYADAS